jgi:hypothetical protein
MYGTREAPCVKIYEQRGVNGNCFVAHRVQRDTLKIYAVVLPSFDVYSDNRRVRVRTLIGRNKNRNGVGSLGDVCGDKFPVVKRHPNGSKWGGGVWPEIQSKRFQILDVQLET